MSGPQVACFPAYLAPTSKIELLLHALLPDASGGSSANAYISRRISPNQFATRL
jgi:hypothetical protein